MNLVGAARWLHTSWGDLFAFTIVAVVGIVITAGDGTSTAASVGMLLVAAPILARRWSVPVAVMGYVLAGIWLNGALFGTTIRCGAQLTALAYLMFWVGRSLGWRQRLRLSWLLPLFLVGEDRFDPVMSVSGALPVAVIMLVGSLGLGVTVRDTERRAQRLREGTRTLQRARSRTATLAGAAERVRVYEQLQAVVEQRFDDILLLASPLRAADAMAKVQMIAADALDQLQTMLLGLRTTDARDLPADGPEPDTPAGPQLPGWLRSAARVTRSGPLAGGILVLLVTSELATSLLDADTGGSLVGLERGKRLAIVAATTTLLLAALCCHRWPMTAALAVSAIGPVLIVTGPQIDYIPTTGAIALAVVSYAAGLRLDTKAAWLAFIFLLLTLQTAEFGWGGGVPVPAYATVGPWIAGLVIRSRRRVTSNLQQLLSQLEEERRRQVLLATLFERRHLLGEVHDILGGALSVTLVQAAAGHHLRIEDPVTSRRCSDIITETIDQARRDVAQLKNGTTQIALPDDLDALIARMRRAGVQITFSRGATPMQVGQDVGRVLYRLVQECLTNALRHAEGAAVVIELLDDDEGLLLVHVHNADAPESERPGRRADGTGLGLAAMRERVNAVGGTMTAGPTADAAGGGWTVRAHLPIGLGATSGLLRPPESIMV